MVQKFLTFNDDEDSLTNWTDTLLHQFKEDVGLAQKAIFKEHYTLENATHKHKFREYTNQIIHNSKFTNLPAYNQLIAIRNSIAVELQQSVPMITKDIYVSDILNIINNAKTDWWTLGAKLTQDSNKDCQHPEQPNQKPIDRENQAIPDHQPAHSYPTYPLNLNTGNYRFSMNSFNSTFPTTPYSTSFPFVYPQNTQTYQYPQTGNKRWQPPALLAPPKKKTIRPPSNQGNQSRNVENTHQPLRNLLNPPPGPTAYPQYGQTAQNQNQQQAGLYHQVQPSQYLLYQNCYFSNQHQYEYSG